MKSSLQSNLVLGGNSVHYFLKAHNQLTDHIQEMSFIESLAQPRAYPVQGTYPKHQASPVLRGFAFPGKRIKLPPHIVK